MGLMADLPVPPERIEAGGVIVRRLTPGDAPALCRAATESLDHLRPWMPWATDDYGPDDARGWQRRALEQFARNDGVQAGIFDRGALVGIIGFHAIDWPNRKTTIGYWLDAASQGRGIMTAACRTMVEHALVELKLNRVEIQRHGYTRVSVAVSA